MQADFAFYGWIAAAAHKDENSKWTLLSVSNMFLTDLVIKVTNLSWKSKLLTSLERQGLSQDHYTSPAPYNALEKSLIDFTGKEWGCSCCPSQHLVPITVNKSPPPPFLFLPPFYIKSPSNTFFSLSYFPLSFLLCKLSQSVVLFAICAQAAAARSNE